MYCAITGGLGVDWINDKVYFSFSRNGDIPNHLAVYDITTGGYSEVVVTSSCAVYYDVYVDPINQFV